jgi:ABC-type sulfate transport system substrate-binding protein
MRGVSITDLPARQTLYFSSGSDNLLLASYNDMITTEFWTTLHENFSKVWQPSSKHGRTVVSKDSYPASMDIHPAKEVLVKEILKQLSLMHQTDVK